MRDRTKRSCSLCLDTWPSAEIVTKFHSCTICGITAHTGCILLAKACPCGAGQRDLSTGGANIRRLNRLQGSVFIKIVQADDLITTTAGTSLVRDFSSSSSSSIFFFEMHVPNRHFYSITVWDCDIIDKQRL